VVPGTKYFFKMGARNSKGYGPSGQVISFTTGRGGAISSVSPATGSNNSSGGGDNGLSPVILYAVAGIGAGIIIVVVIGAVVVVHRCTKTSDSAAGAAAGSQAERNKKYLNGEVSFRKRPLTRVRFGVRFYGKFKYKQNSDHLLLPATIRSVLPVYTIQ
jgi:hypothetical protein